MAIFNKKELAYRWAKSICEKLVVLGKIKPSELGNCVEKASREYFDHIRDIDEKYLRAIIGLDPELAAKIIEEYKKSRIY